jgi:hypothetical protein
LRTERGLELVARDKYPLVAYDTSDKERLADDYVEVFQCVPRVASDTVAERPAINRRIE